MSFSKGVKAELIRHLPEARHCQIAFLAGLFQICGEYEKSRLIFRSQNLEISKICFTLLLKLCSIYPNVSVRQGRFPSYTVGFLGDAAAKAGKMLKLQEEHTHIDERIIEASCCKRAFLKAFFLGAGSLSDPGRSYHLEFVCEKSGEAEFLSALVHHFGINSKVGKRKGRMIVYLKEGDDIVNMLRILEAPLSLMEMENTRILKEMRGNVNRRVNCETSNIRKTVSAARRQINDIEYIERVKGLMALPEGLREIAEIRLNFPDEPLSELGAHLNPPVGKSGVNHRLRKLSEIADDMRKSSL